MDVIKIYSVLGKLANSLGQRPEAPASGKIEDISGKIQSPIGRTTKNKNISFLPGNVT